jgi:hypothetical protein
MLHQQGRISVVCSFLLSAFPVWICTCDLRAAQDAPVNALRKHFHVWENSSQGYEIHVPGGGTDPWANRPLTDADIAAVLADLQALPRIDMLFLGSSEISDSGLLQLSRLTNLRAVKLDYVENISDKGLSSLSQSKRLERLYFAGTQKFTGTGFCAFAKSSKLHTLQLYGTGITLDGVRCVSQIGTLRTLIIDGGYVRGDELVPCLTRLKELESLRLSAVRLTDVSVPLFRGFPKLRHLDLTANRGLTDASVKVLSQMHKLKTLKIDKPGSGVLGANQFSPAGVKELKGQLGEDVVVAR